MLLAFQQTSHPSLMEKVSRAPLSEELGNFSPHCHALEHEEKATGI